MKNRNPLIRKILLQYFIAMILLLCLLVAIPLLLRFLAGFRVWYETDFLYPVFNLINNNLLFAIALGATMVWICTTIYFVSRIVGFLNETTQAMKQLMNEPERRIQLSQDLFEVQEEMNQLREKSNQDRRAAKEAEQRKNDLIVYLAHDLRTPLTSVIGYLTLLKEEPQLSAEFRARYTDIALDKAERLEQLISEFFEITRFNLTDLIINKETVDLSIMMEQISYEFLPILNEKKLNWQLEIEKNITASVDPEKMERVFDNLIRNAINYSFPDSAIQLVLKENRLKENPEIEIQVINSGRTIPAEKLTRIFEPFYRMDSSRGSITGGTGLGLPIAKDIIEAFGGSIQAQSAAEKIVFTVIVPKNN